MQLSESIKQTFRNKTQLKNKTIDCYAHCLMRFCKDVSAHTNVNIDAFTLLNQHISWIHKETCRFIRRYEMRLDTNEVAKQAAYAPKHLNAIYCAIKKWLVINGKCTNDFHKIRFDKRTNKNVFLNEQALETEHMRKMFKISDYRDHIDLGLYGLCGLEPYQICTLKVANIFEKHLKIENNRVMLNKPTFVNASKRKTEYIVILPSRISEELEIKLNEDIAHLKLNSQTDILNLRLSDCHNERDVYRKIKRLFNAIGFKGLLRDYAHSILKRIDDVDLREFLIGHKCGIKIRGISELNEVKYTEKYICACEQFINENVFDLVRDDNASSCL